MTQLSDSLIPSPGERGLVTADRARLTAAVTSSWDLFAALVEPLDLDAPTRAAGLTVREVVTPLGAWDDNRPISEVLDEARRGIVGDHDQSALVDAVRERHRHEPAEAVHAALARQARDVRALLARDDLDEVASAPVASMLGTLPLLTFVHAATYPLATSALDLERAGAVVPDQLLTQGLGGLLDTIGALLARQGVSASLAAVTPDVTVVAAARAGDWRCTEIVGRHDGWLGPAVIGSARTLLDVTAGRADVPSAVGRGHLKVDDWSGLLALAPVVEQVPGIPGRTALLAAAKAAGALTGVWRLLGRRN